jgi:phospholipase/carboxylesterase
MMERGMGPEMDRLDARVMDAPSPRDGTPVLVLLHGRGADPSDLVDLRPWLPDDLTLVLPRAPFSAAQWGYGPGWAWYRYAGDDRPEVESFRSSQQTLEAFLGTLAGRLGYEPGPLLLGGFSQGGTMSLGFALRRPGTVHGALNFSGFLPDHPDVPVTPEAAGATPIFWGHGTADPAIPHTLAVRGRQALETAGARLDARDYPIGHAISPEELGDAVEWMERTLSEA